MERTARCRVRSRAPILLVVALLLLTAHSAPTARGATTPSPSPSVSPKDLYFAGDLADQANKVAGRPTATFGEAPPAGTTPITQTASPIALEQPRNPLAIFWEGAFAGPIDNAVQLDWFWSTTNPAVVGADVAVTVGVHADGDPARLGGRAGVTLTDLQLSPTRQVSRVDMRGAATSSLVVTAIPSVDGLLVSYGATSTPSLLRITSAPATPPAGTAIRFGSPGLDFGPATVVSAQHLSYGPQLAVRGSRRFASAPASLAGGFSVLSRSDDDGDSFRLLFDPACAPRSRPTCAIAGGGDSQVEVHPDDGTVTVVELELAQTAIASSVDAGDTFPVDRQHVVTGTSAGVERPWLASIPAGLAFDPLTGLPITTLLSSFAVTEGGIEVGGVTTSGRPVLPATPQIPAGSTGIPRVDSTNGPGRGWVYHPHIGASGSGGAFVRVATAPAGRLFEPDAWRVTPIFDRETTVFPALALDDRGNAHMAFASAGRVLLRSSPIDDVRNSPASGGRPGTFWRPAIDVTPPDIGSAALPAVVAGAAGNVAVAFYGSADFVGVPDDAPVTARWHVHVVALPDALRPGGAPARRGVASHRPVKVGRLCAAGQACASTGADHGFGDVLDADLDDDGRLVVSFGDNNSTFARINDNARVLPFQMVARQSGGPSLAGGVIDAAPAMTGSVSDSDGDATWPARANAAALPALDLLGLAVDRDDQVLRIQLRVADLGAASGDLARYNAAAGGNAPAERLQYVTRFATEDDLFHVSFEIDGAGGMRSFAGRLDRFRDGLGITPFTERLGAAYHADPAVLVAGTVTNGTIELSVPLASLGLSPSGALYSVTSFAMAGPSEGNEVSIANPMRTIDATTAIDVPAI